MCVSARHMPNSLSLFFHTASSSVSHFSGPCFCLSVSLPLCFPLLSLLLLFPSFLFKQTDLSPATFIPSWRELFGKRPQLCVTVWKVEAKHSWCKTAKDQQSCKWPNLQTPEQSHPLPSIELNTLAHTSRQQQSFFFLNAPFHSSVSQPCLCPVILCTRAPDAQLLGWNVLNVCMYV